MCVEQPGAKLRFTHCFTDEISWCDIAVELAKYFINLADFERVDGPLGNKVCDIPTLGRYRDLSLYDDLNLKHVL